MTRFQRWAAILLPLVILARAVLLIFQIGGEHREEAHADDPPSWPPVPGEELRFRRTHPRAAAWATAPDRPRLLVAVTRRGLVPADADAGCLLDPAALLQHGGKLTLRSQTPGQGWLADWDGGATVATPAEAATDEPDPHLRAVESNMLEAASCGGVARLELTEWQAHVLVNALSGSPAPPESPPARRRDLHINVEGPPP